MRRRFFHGAMLAVVLGFVSLAGVSFAPSLAAQNATRDLAGDLTVSAAASLQDVLNAIATAFKTEAPGIAVHYNLGASGTLQQQIEQGAPVDVFLSAAPAQMDALAAKGMLLDGSRRDLLRNSVVLITPKTSGDVKSFRDLANAKVRFVAIGEPQTVPAGTYGKQVLTHLGMYDSLQAKFVFAKDVRQVLTYVATGNADAGIVYGTDAKTSNDVRVVAIAPDDSHDPVIYPVAILKGSRNTAAAKSFTVFLEGPKARAIFEQFGFMAIH